jgi:hypothetical protein
MVVERQVCLSRRAPRGGVPLVHLLSLEEKALPGAAFKEAPGSPATSKIAGRKRKTSKKHSPERPRPRYAGRGHWLKVRTWLEPYTMLWRYWRAYSYLCPLSLRPRACLRECFQAEGPTSMPANKLPVGAAAEVDRHSVVFLAFLRRHFLR